MSDPAFGEGQPPSDLPANALQAAFNNRLNTILDAVRRPADALTTNPQLVCDLDRLPEGDEKYWGEFAELEATDVKLATVNFLGQWRKYTTKHERPAHNYRSKSMANIATPGLVMLSSGQRKLKTRILAVEAVGGVKKSSSDPNLCDMDSPPNGTPTKGSPSASPSVPRRAQPQAGVV